MQNNIIRIALITFLILLIPLIAMLFTSEVNWNLFDFVVMGALIFITGLSINLAYRKAGKNKAVVIAATILFFLWLWAELAVGVFTNWGS